jgi:hypothetical protein
MLVMGNGSPLANGVFWGLLSILDEVSMRGYDIALLCLLLCPFEEEPQPRETQHP